MKLLKRLFYNSVMKYEVPRNMSKTQPLGKLCNSLRALNEGKHICVQNWKILNYLSMNSSQNDS